MNKKEIFLSSLVLILVIGFGIFYVPKINNFFKKAPAPVQNEMSGTITEVKGNSIVVEGLVGNKNKSITFAMTSETILKNSSRTITLEQMKSGKPFVPKYEEKVGKMSDFTVNLKIDKIRSQENLLVANNAIATEIDYATFIYPTK